MTDNSFIRKYMGQNKKEAPEEEPLRPKKKPPQESFDQTVKRYHLWQISGDNVMKADQVKIGNVKIIDQNQPWNVVSSWSLGYFDGGAIRQIYNWSQTQDPKYIKAAQHYLSKMLEEINKGSLPPVTVPPPDVSGIQNEIEKMASKLANPPMITPKEE